MEHKHNSITAYWKEISAVVIASVALAGCNPPTPSDAFNDAPKELFEVPTKNLTPGQDPNN